MGSICNSATLVLHTYRSFWDHKLRVQHVHSSFFHPLVMSVSIICPFIFCSHSFTFCDDNLPRRRKNKTEFSPIFPHMFQIYCFYILHSTFYNHILFCQNSHFDDISVAIAVISFQNQKEENN